MTLSKARTNVYENVISHKSLCTLDFGYCTYAYEVNGMDNGRWNTHTNTLYEKTRIIHRSKVEVVCMMDTLPSSQRNSRRVPLPDYSCITVI